jgi:phosphoserine phosphatase
MKKDIKLAVFDFDSTLMDGETIDKLAIELNLEQKVTEITTKAMNGDINFFESLTERVALLKGLPVSKVNEICQNLPYINGAKNIISYLKNNGVTVVCFSGGFRNATSHAKKILGFNADFSNILYEKNGILTGQVGGEMMFDFSKGDMLQRLQNILNISQKETMVVGDGANDLSMFKFADTKIAFCGKDILKKEASIIIENKNLEEIKEYL